MSKHTPTPTEKRRVLDELEAADAPVDQKDLADALPWSESKVIGIVDVLHDEQALWRVRSTRGGGVKIVFVEATAPPAAEPVLEARGHGNRLQGGGGVRSKP
ncbi:hypothetical protein EFA46_016075 (plasmid) [Halarchaeum sp. CBA1220]|uniref:DUF7343 domain-containing protein n=1 Tax=Halarchaeum sp. CBA1220 TaxID=1853682 RepID=UPI0015A0E99F|nr:hypothetical protein [Halarchaeum sp. CBA1220]QLC35774.1 hypothetical protein EFA46_016075 [Halarchaeum sp. CBA1220]